MGSDKSYRWNKRRQRKLSRRKSFHLDILDWVMFALIFIMFFISLRLFFLFEGMFMPCTELMLTAGQSSGLPPIFEMTYVISLLMGGFWLCVTLLRIMTGRKDWKLIAWHIVMFLAVFFLGLMNWNLTSSSYVKPPDGVMVVENIVPEFSNGGVSWPQSEHIRWADRKDGQWYASGFKACIWLEENKVSYNDRFDIMPERKSGLTLFLKGRVTQTLLENQLYRPLSDYERERFLDIQACEADITRYGQHWTVCQSKWLYPVHPDLKPPPHVKKLYPTQ